MLVLHLKVAEFFLETS